MRILGQLAVVGGITFMSVKGDIASALEGNPQLEIVNVGGEPLVARAGTQLTPRPAIGDPVLVGTDNTLTPLGRQRLATLDSNLRDKLVQLEQQSLGKLLTHGDPAQLANLTVEQLARLGRLSSAAVAVVGKEGQIVASWISPYSVRAVDTILSRVKDIEQATQLVRAYGRDLPKLASQLEAIEGVDAGGRLIRGIAFASSVAGLDGLVKRAGTFAQVEYWLIHAGELKAAGIRGDVDAIAKRALGTTADALAARGELRAAERAAARGYQVEMLEPPTGRAAQNIKSPEARLRRGGDEFRYEVKTATEAPKASTWNAHVTKANTQVKSAGGFGEITFDWTQVDIRAAESEFKDQAAIERFMNGKMTNDRMSRVRYFEIVWTDPDGHITTTSRTRAADGSVGPITTVHQ